MNLLRTLGHMARADFFERSRRYSFLVTLGLGVYAANGFLPPNDSAYVTMQLGGHRGLYNSAWVGVLVAILTGTFLSLVGFYLVKGAIARDRETRVGQILAATSLSKLAYTVGKTLSNFLVLAAMTGVIAISAGLVQVLRAEDTQIALIPLLAPFVLLTLPAMLVTAALAVFFEAVPGLRGGLGNVVYFFLWTALLTGFGSIRDTIEEPHNDWLGRGLAMPSIVSACQEAFPDFDPDSSGMSMGLTFREGGWSLTTFRWEGVQWTAAAVGGRASWVAVALGLAMVSALPFDRFDPARTGHRRARPPTRPRRRRAWAPWTWWVKPDDVDADDTSETAIERLEPLDRRVASASAVRRLTTFVVAELKLSLREQGRWWYLVLAGLWVASLTTSLSDAQRLVLPLLWVWPMLVWSPLGTRECVHRTDQVLFSAPHPIGIQLSASWLAGCALALASGSIVILRLMASGDWSAVAGVLVGAAFVPALALALGTWTGTPRTFEALYIIWWYTGPLQPIPVLDFMGVSSEAIAAGMPGVYGAMTLGLLAAAVLGRRMALRR